MSNLYCRMHQTKKNKFLKMNGMIWIMNGKLLKIQESKINNFNQTFYFRSKKLVLIKIKFIILKNKQLKVKK